tara:strand:+ start:294 stop:956 length:663 start_codon:yes stop_codon:yes gene_type:complete
MSDEIMVESVDTEATENTTQEAKTFSQEELDRIVADRVQREKRKLDKKLEGIDLEEARQLMIDREQATIERQKEKGEFESILKQTVEKKDMEISQYKQRLESTLIDGSLLSAASKYNAVEPNQVAQLLRSSLKLADDGSVEILDSNGTVRYNEKADPLSVDEVVGDFLTANPHFVRATPSGAGTLGNAGGSTQKPQSVESMVENWRNGGREAYRALQKKT